MATSKNQTWRSMPGFRVQDQPDLRVGDSERTEAADRLSQHYSDGRLDQAEFNERLDRAMAAKTHADLRALFTDLPASTASEVCAAKTAQTERRTRRASDASRLVRVLCLVAVVLIVAAVANSMVGALIGWPFRGWLWVALVIFLVVRFVPRRRHW